MRLAALLPLTLASSLVAALPAQRAAPQHILSSSMLDQLDEVRGWADDDTGTGHLSQWSRQNKVSAVSPAVLRSVVVAGLGLTIDHNLLPWPFPILCSSLTGIAIFGHLTELQEDFLSDLRNNSANEWLVVMGNEAGDLDSLVSAVALAYMYEHLDPPQKAVALLQTEQDALDLRPENALALHYALMSTRHRDLLTIDELPIKPVDMGHRIKGIALVDHNVPRSEWDSAEILAIIDHHEDQGLANGTANPRIIEKSGSCSSLVTRYLLDELHEGSKPTAKDTVDAMTHGPLPKELVELLLRTIAIDSDGLSKKSRQPVDKESAERLLPRSSFKHRQLKEVMKIFDKDLSASRKALDGLDLRSLLRRDWKGDSIPTKSNKYPTIALGFASAPVSLEDQILRTPEQTTPEWFAIERAWTAEIQADVSVALSNFRHPETGEKTRQLTLVVAHGFGKRLHEGSANRLFHQLKSAIENAGIELQKWKRPDGKALLPRRAVYEYQSATASRKFWRPILEQAVREWEG